MTKGEMGTGQSLDLVNNVFANDLKDDKTTRDIQNNEDFDDILDLFFQNPIKQNTRYYVVPDIKQWESQYKELGIKYPNWRFQVFTSCAFELRPSSFDITNNTIIREELEKYLNLLNNSNGNNINDHRVIDYTISIDNICIIGNLYDIYFVVDDIISKDEYSIIPIGILFMNKMLFPLPLNKTKITIDSALLVGRNYVMPLNQIRGLTNDILCPGILRSHNDMNEIIIATPMAKLLHIYKGNYLYLSINMMLISKSLVVDYYDNGVISRSLIRESNGFNYAEYHNGVYNGQHYYSYHNSFLKCFSVDGYIVGKFEVSMDKEMRIVGTIDKNLYPHPREKSRICGTIFFNTVVNHFLNTYSDCFIGKYKSTIINKKGKCKETRYYNHNHVLHGICTYKYNYSLSDEELKKGTCRGIHEIKVNKTIIKRFYIDGVEHPMKLFYRINDILQKYLITDLSDIIIRYVF